ncbi:reticulon-like protein B11 [Prosopis cineraria]|uniref:reticulon-like protein B11 n=1 Tax=Prosopis cineraria TaxID=364024 RepID=UPI00240F5B70|nr:reticulon-like protein B11 [Prosopis cineraria]
MEEEPKLHRRISVHQALGGGLAADVLLWRKWYGGVVVLVSETILWLVFERAGYNLISFVANVLLLLVVFLFFWAKAASLLNRSLPPLPDLIISEESICNAADILQIWINRAMYIAHDIAIERNLVLSIQVAAVFLVISVIGSLFNFLTLIYLGVLLSLSVPLLYDKYQDRIDNKMYTMHQIIQTQYRKFENNVLRNIPIPSNKAKKME